MKRAVDVEGKMAFLVVTKKLRSSLRYNASMTEAEIMPVYEEKSSTLVPM